MPAFIAYLAPFADWCFEGEAQVAASRFLPVPVPIPDAIELWRNEVSKIGHHDSRNKSTINK
jgi:hypothetical protein